MTPQFREKRGWSETNKWFGCSERQMKCSRCRRRMDAVVIYRRGRSLFNDTRANSLLVVLDNAAAAAAKIGANLCLPWHNVVSAVNVASASTEPPYDTRTVRYSSPDILSVNANVQWTASIHKSFTVLACFVLYLHFMTCLFYVLIEWQLRPQ